jgi:hypothetical protein
MVEHPPSFKGQRRNTTVVVAIWVLGVVAFLEIVFASIALTPRILTAVRNSQSVHLQAIAPTVPATQPPSQSAQTLPSQPLDETAVPPLNKDVSTPDTPLQPAASEAAPQQGTSTLGIVSAKLDGSDEGSRKLLISIKADPKIPIDVPQVKVQVYFYDTDGTEITPSKAQVTSTWTTPPVDWKDGEPELLEVRYLPDSTDPDIKFAGYVVAIYYKGDLQDYRSEPAQLTKLFPLKYFIGTDE